MAILVSETWSSLTPTCYEPTSGLGPPLLYQSCMATGLAIIEQYPLDLYTLVHYKTDNPTYIQCPLNIEISGCLFTLEFFGAIDRVRIDRQVITDAIIVILVNCVNNPNFDGGEIVVGKDNWTKFSLTHPPKLTGKNVTSLGDTQLNGTSISPAHSNADLFMSGDNNPSFIVPSR